MFFYALPYQQVLDFNTEQDRDHHQQGADGATAQGIVEGVAGGDGQQYRHQCGTQAEQRGQVFAEDHDQLALAGAAEPLPQSLVAADLVDLADTAKQ